MEILQLLGSQKKSGCLVLEWNTERALVWVTDGRIVSTRAHGMSKDDPLAAFLLQTHRLSDEQFRGLLTIQRESGRDLEDLLTNGRYVESDELGPLLERQILNDLTRLVRWENGTYRFDPNVKWPGAPLVTLSMEGAMMEAARRVDEQKHFVGVFKDPHQLLGVHDLPDPNEPLSDEEREIFGIIDGQHTVAEVVKAAPLCEYEAYESLHRMLQAHWIEFVGRRDPGVSPAKPVAPPPRTDHQAPRWVNELIVAGVMLVAVVLVRFVASQVSVVHTFDPATDVYAASDARDLRFAVELYALGAQQLAHARHHLPQARLAEVATAHARLVGDHGDRMTRPPHLVQCARDAR